MTPCSRCSRASGLNSQSRQPDVLCHSNDEPGYEHRYTGMTPRVGVSILGGAAVGIIAAVLVSAITSRVWPAYGVAEATRAYTFVMLVARLVAGAVCMAASAWTTTRLAGDTGRAALALGTLACLGSTVHHIRIWPAYPAWYHVVYLSYLVPVSAFVGRRSGRAQHAR
jgi:hypothetical protein